MSHGVENENTDRLRRRLCPHGFGCLLGGNQPGIAGQGRATGAILSENYRSILVAENMVDALEHQDSGILLLFLSDAETGIAEFRENEAVFLGWLARAKDNIKIAGEAELLRSIEAHYAAYRHSVQAIQRWTITNDNAQYTRTSDVNQKALGPMDATPARSLRFLLCDTAGKVGGLSSSDQAWVSSPIQCLDKAVDAKPGLIVIRIGDMPIRERDTLVELSATLKRNRHTRNCPVLALLHSRHRKLLEDLSRAGVAFIKVIGDCTLDSGQMRQIINALGPHDRLERYLETVCPFVHYRQIDSRHEMVLCGAYLDRMVLGGGRLHELCETIDHLYCEYYLNPRRKA